MNKKFASLGTVLSRDEAKKVMGGNYTEIGGDNGGSPSCSEMCSKDADCAGNSSCSKCKAGEGPNGGKGCAA